MALLQRITPDDGHYFFGYYDLQPFSSDNRLHLAHRVSFMDRLQKAGDRCDIGLIDLTDRSFHKLTETESWNFQQGAMLQWNPIAPNSQILFNCFREGEYQTCCLDIRNNATRYLSRPVANVSRDGKWGLSINFSRLYDFRPGYGYPCKQDPHFYENHPAEDGVFLVDMVTGNSRLILSLETLWNFTGSYFDGDRKLVINHITWNPDATRFVLLLRNFPTDARPHRTAVITADRNGENLFLLSDYGYFSHYYWEGPRDLIAYADGKELAVCQGIQNYRLQDLSYNGSIIDAQSFPEDNHMSLSPCGRYLLNDAYPDENREQKLFVYDLREKENISLGRFYSPVFPVIDIRCDLHPRWSYHSGLVSFDSVHEGFRGIYTIEAGGNLWK